MSASWSPPLFWGMVQGLAPGPLEDGVVTTVDPPVVAGWPVLAGLVLLHADRVIAAAARAIQTPRVTGMAFVSRRTAESLSEPCGRGADCSSL